MKTKFISLTLLAFTLSGKSQVWTTTFGTPGYESTPGKAEIGPPGAYTPPTNHLEVHSNDPYYGGGGARISQHASTGSAALHLFADNSEGNSWALFSLGNGNHIASGTNNGDFSIVDETAGSSGLPCLTIKRRTGRVGIGTNNATLAKLQVEESSAPTAGWFSANGAFGGAANTTGLVSQSNYWNLSTSVANVGVDASANPGGQSYGYGIGVWGTCYLSKTSIGGRFDANSYGSGVQNIGVYASTSGNGSTNWAGYFVGDVYRSGTDNFTSDRKLKDNIKPLSSALEKLMQLKPSTYTFRTDEFKMMNLPKGEQMGLIAQDLEQVLPNLVTNMPEMKIADKDGKETVTPEFKSVQYISLIPLLIGGLQEQQSIIENLQNKISDQQQQIINMQQKTSVTTGIAVVSSIETGFQMSQNEPNPFTHETVVKYTLPAGVTSAFMAVYDLTGKQITTFPIEQKGSSSLTLTSEKLAAGIYLYSIVADGKVMDTKRMIVSEK